MGCKLNLADSELLAKKFAGAGYQVLERQEDGIDVVVVNTCTVTHVADRKARHLLLSARKRNPYALIVATGCYPERAPDELAKIDGIDLILGNSSKDSLVDLVTARLHERDLAPITDPLLPSRMSFLPNQTRSFVKIQEGCNDFCSYCIIPKTRGHSRSFAVDEILAALKERETAGFPEVVLTGTQLGDYGIESPGSRRRGPDVRDQASEGDPLADLLEVVVQRTKIPRIRLSSLQPQDITPRLLSLWEGPRLCPHFHLPLQSGADSVLQRMRRRYRTQEYISAVERIRAAVPDVSITTDVIVGFPGETQEEFNETYSLVESLGFADIHVFPYSVRAGTLAARLGNPVAEPVRKDRVRRLLALAEHSHLRHRQSVVGKERPVLWEERKALPVVSREPVWSGLTDNYLRVFSQGQGELSGRMTRAKIACIYENELWATVGA